MNAGKALFAQVVGFFVPWTTFARIVQCHAGNASVRALTRAKQFRAMAFAQLTWRESLRNIEASLSANNATKVHAMGFRDGLPLGGQAFHTDRRELVARLAHLARPGGGVDSPRT